MNKKYSLKLMSLCLSTIIHSKLYGDEIIWNDNGSLTVAGQCTFVIRTNYSSSDGEQLLLDPADFYSLKKNNLYGLVLEGLTYEYFPAVPTSQIPDKLDGATVRIYELDPEKNNPVKILYGAFASRNSNNQNEILQGYWSIDPENQHWSAPHSKDIRKLLLSKKVTSRKNTIKGGSLKNRIPVYIKVTVKNATLKSLTLPGLGTFSAFDLIKKYSEQNNQELKNIYNNRQNYNYTFVTADRGLFNGGEFSENTIQAFEKAIEVGSDILGVSLRFTKDQIPVACHDRHLSQLFDIESIAAEKGIPISDMTIDKITVEEFKNLNTKNRFGEVLPQKPNTLTEIFKRFPDKLIALRLNVTNGSNENDHYAMGENEIEHWKVLFSKSIETAVEMSVLNNILIKVPSIINPYSLDVIINILDDELDFSESYDAYLECLKENEQDQCEEDFHVYLGDFFHIICIVFESDFERNPSPFTWKDYKNEAEEYLLGIRGLSLNLESNFKHNDDLLLKDAWFENLHEDFQNIGLSCFYANHPEGVLMENEEGEFEIFVYTPDIQYPEESESSSAGIALDNRGNLDWAMHAGHSNMLTTVHPKMVINWLQAQGKRNLSPIVE